ncbi:MAG: YdcF family protein [Verrucomicrobiota bacterium]
MNLSWTRRFWLVAGVFFLSQLLLALTGTPQALRDWLNGTACYPQETPRYVIVLSGGGIPSESSLIRAYYAAQFGRGLTGTTFVVAMPADRDPEHSSVGRFRDELVLRGIPADRILMETHGRNTYQQAGNIRQLLGTATVREPVLVVTSGFHVRRAMLCFRKQGFESVAGLDAASISAEAYPGWFAYLRYSFWSNLTSQITITRELLAIFGYKLAGCA